MDINTVSYQDASPYTQQPPAVGAAHIRVIGRQAILHLFTYIFFSPNVSAERVEIPCFG